jgi:hypothetical protein
MLTLTKDDCKNSQHRNNEADSPFEWRHVVVIKWSIDALNTNDTI